MYVPGGCNIPLVSDCDLKCDRKKKLMGNIQIASLYKLSLLLCFLPIFMKGAKRARALSFWHVFSLAFLHGHQMLSLSQLPFIEVSLSYLIQQVL